MIRTLRLAFMLGQIALLALAIRRELQKQET